MGKPGAHPITNKAIHPPRMADRPVVVLFCLTVIVAIILIGCTSSWQRVRGPALSPSCSIQMPEGWMRLSTNAYEMVSKDGPYLEYILLREQPLIQGFGHTRRKINIDMLPYEAAQVIIDNLNADPAIKRFRIISNEPADINGREGFHLVFTYRDQQDVDMRTHYYGIIVGSSFVSLRYNAAQRHYFDAELPAFQAALQSLRCSSNPKD